MHEAETRALRRAVGLLIAISVLRWGWDERGPAPSNEDGTVLPTLLTASREAAGEQARRDAPLGTAELVDITQADEVELDRLPGIGPSTARAIVVAREGGMVFQSPDDLLAVRGIGPATLERIRAFISAPARRAPSAPPPRASAGSVADPVGRPVVDLNEADLEALISLPGIGPAIAERILVARREQPFTSIEDLARVRGIGPATVERLRPRASVGRRGLR